MGARKTAAERYGELKSELERIRGNEAAVEKTVKAAVKAEKKERRFDVARVLLVRFRREADRFGASLEFRRWIRQQTALCTYKDPALALRARLDAALAVLGAAAADGDPQDAPNVSTNPETLCLHGAILKRRWGHEQDPRDLRDALAYYSRAVDVVNTRPNGLADDNGYAAVNAAFVHDLAASEAGDAAARVGHWRQANDLREKTRTEILARKDKSIWWRAASLVECEIGLGRNEEAIAAALAANKLDRDPWETESTVRQLVALRVLRRANAAGTDDPEADEGLARVLAALAGSQAAEVRAAVRSTMRGKLGLGLSGGGFRAALFHLGTLAALADLDRLRDVEVLSCVSGGSIVGAAYYLRLKKLLESKRDGDVLQFDYQQLVRELTDDFVAGVQRDLRNRLLANPCVSVRALFFRGDARTRALAELYGDRLFPPGTARLPLRKTRVAPIGANNSRNTTFHPTTDNWYRSAKVPILVLNATTLNTGHNWQFTANWMGEAPSEVDTTIDAVPRLRRVNHNEAPRRLRSVRVVDAVAASSCVPGLFDPLEIDGLYDGVNVRLVDGGVYDNQGIASLLEQDCDALFVSDACGQLSLNPGMASGAIGALFRTPGVQMARVRQAQYADLLRRAATRRLRAFRFVHQQRGLARSPIAWVGAPEGGNTRELPPHSTKKPAGRRVNKKIQRALAAMRTDLDAFSEDEAHALAACAYLQTRCAFAAADDDTKDAENAKSALEDAQRWKFGEMAKKIATPCGVDNELLRRLRAGSKMTCREFCVTSRGMRTVLFLILLISVALPFLFTYYVARVVPTVGTFDAAAWCIAAATLVLALTLAPTRLRRRRLPFALDRVLPRLTSLLLLWCGWSIFGYAAFVARPAILRASRSTAHLGK